MTSRLLLAPAFAFALGLGATTLAMPARAQDQEAIAAARAKFQRAIELEQAGDYGGAVKLFRDVGQVKMTPQVRYHIATCEEELGKLVAALGGYEIALAQSSEMPPEFIAEVEEAIQDLRARIPKLVIERGEGAEAATITLDGVTLGAKKVGVEVPLDPGPHTVSAKAPGYEDYSQTVTVRETEVETLAVELVELTAETPLTQSGSGTSSAEPEEKKGFGVWPFVIGGVGLAAAGVGAALLPISQGKASEAEDICGGTNCDALGDTDPAAWQEARSLVDQANTLETVGWISVGVGAAALGTGVVLLLIDPSRSSEKSGAEAADETGRASRRLSVSWSPTAPGANAGLSLSGKF